MQKWMAEWIQVNNEYSPPLPLQESSAQNQTHIGRRQDGASFWPAGDGLFLDLSANTTGVITA